MKEKELKLGVTFKSTLPEWKDSVLKIVWSREIQPSSHGAWEIKDLFTKNVYDDYQKARLCSALCYKVKQNKHELKYLRTFAKEIANVEKAVVILNKAQSALSKIDSIAGRKDIQAKIDEGIDRWDRLAKSWKSDWKKRLFDSYKRI